MRPTAHPTLNRHGWLLAAPAIACGGGGADPNEPIVGDWDLVEEVQISSAEETRQAEYSEYCAPAYDVLTEFFVTGMDLRIGDDNIVRSNLDERRIISYTCDVMETADDTREFYLSGTMTETPGTEETPARWRIPLRSDQRSFPLDCAREPEGDELRCEDEERGVTFRFIPK